MPPFTANGALQMAIDEVLLAAKIPTLRLYQWFPPCITIGYFQALDWEVNRAAAKRSGVDIVRRQTGGGAVLHDTELTYSLIVPQVWLGSSQDIPKSYAVVCGIVAKALQSFCCNAEFSPINDILVHGKKISGSAQTRSGGWMLQHGTILLDVDVERMFSLLKVPNEKLRNHVLSNAKARVTSLKHEGVNFTVPALCAELRKEFNLAFARQLHDGKLSKQSLLEAYRLMESKYNNASWTAKW